MFCADPAHVPFAHHGVIGSRALGSPMGIEIDDEAATGANDTREREDGRRRRGQELSNCSAAATRQTRFCFCETNRVLFPTAFVRGGQQ